MDYQDDYHNPIVADQDHANVYRNMLADLASMCLLTINLDKDVTAKFAALSIQAIIAGDHPDTLVSIKAFGYEVGRFLAHIAETSSKPEFRHASDNPPASDGTVDLSLVTIQLETFMAAAHRGDLDSAVNVIDSVVAEANATGQQAEKHALVFVVSVFMSIILTVRHRMNENHTGHGCGLDPDVHTD